MILYFKSDNKLVKTTVKIVLKSKRFKIIKT